MTLILSMMGLGLLLAIEKTASGGTAPPGGVALKANFNLTATDEAWVFM